MAKILQYQNLSDLLFALSSDKVDVGYFDQTSQEDDVLREQFNTFLKEIRQNGVYQDMVTRWMGKGLEEMPAIKAINARGLLKAGVVSVLARKASLANSSGTISGAGNLSLFKKISNSFYNNIILEKRYLHILEGLKVTLLISVFAAMLGTLIGGGGGFRIEFWGLCFRDVQNLGGKYRQRTA